MASSKHLIFVFAGEASGDLHGANLLEALSEKRKDLTFVGVGGPKMRAAGLQTVIPLEKFQVMGFLDVFRALPRLMFLFFKVRAAILKLNPSLVITIDYPGFNLRLAQSLRKKGFTGKLCHYISPTVWAWGKNRISLLEKNIDLLLTILPFEKAYFANSSLPVAYVGHPLIQKIPDPVCAKPSTPQLLLFPGSRKKEIERNLPLYLYVCKQLRQEIPSLKIALSVASPALEPLIRAHIQKENITLFPAEQNLSFIKESTVALAKSGTITLELALYGLPTVVTYGMSSLDIFLAKHIFHIHLPYYALPNLIAQKEVFPEFIGPACTQENVYLALYHLLTHLGAQDSCVQKCLALRSLLGPQDASKEAAAKISALL